MSKNTVKVAKALQKLTYQEFLNFAWHINHHPAKDDDMPSVLAAWVSQEIARGPDHD